VSERNLSENRRRELSAWRSVAVLTARSEQAARRELSVGLLA
jgi:hypothetical protein